MKKNILISFFLAVLLVLILSSCLMPEKFDCKVVIKQNGTVEVMYKGTVVDGNIFMGSDEASIKASFNNLVKDNPRISSYKYEGNGRASFVYNVSIPANQNSSFDDDGFLLFTIYRNGRKTIITHDATDIDTINQLKDFGYNLNGTITYESEIELSSPDITFKKSGNKWIGTQRITSLSTKDIVISTVN